MSTRPIAAEPDERLRGAAERFLGTGALDRSVPLRRLFDFLLECTLAGRMPREIEVAQDVFGRTSEFDIGQDATIRVHIHRLRRKLEEFRLAYPDEPAYLTIPRGEYRLVVSEAATAEAIEDEEPRLAPLPMSRRRKTQLWGLGLALLVLLNLGGWAFDMLRDHRPASIRALARNPFWAPLAQSSSPTVIVVGDYYIVGEAPDGMEVRRLVREFSINSRDDLDEYLMLHPDQIGRLVDLNLHYLPVGAASALRSVLPVIDGLQEKGRVRIITGSQLTPEIIQGSNIVYVGYLSGLGLLRNAVFAASSLKVGDSYDELIDTKTNKHYASDWSQIANGEMPQQDYGYLANVPLPGGKHLLVIAGTRDAALMQSAESAADPKQMVEIGKQTSGAPGAEALLQVSAIGNAALAGKLVLARPLAARAGGAAPSPHFPDDVLDH